MASPPVPSESSRVAGEENQTYCGRGKCRGEPGLPESGEVSPSWRGGIGGEILERELS